MPLHAYTPGIQSPKGLELNQPFPVDTWSGPYSAGTTTAAVALANSIIPDTVRFLSLEVRVLAPNPDSAGNTLAYKFWYRGSTANTGLVEFASASSGSSITDYVTSFNGRTGAVQGVSSASAGTGISISPSGGTGAITITNIGVQTFNGLTGNVGGVCAAQANTFTALNTFTSGISAAGGVTFAGALSGTTASFSRLVTASEGITTSGIYASTGSTFAGTLQVSGGSTFATIARFTAGITTSGIYASTGSTFGGTLQVVGGSTLGGRVDVGGLLDVVGGITAESTLDVSGAAKFNGNVTIGDAASDVLTVTSGATFGVTDHSGSARFASSAAFNGAVTINGSPTTIGDVSGDRLVVNATLEGITSTGAVLANGGLTASALDVTNFATFNNRVYANQIYATSGQTLRIVDGITLSSTVDFTSSAKFNGNVTVGDAATDALTVVSGATFAITDHSGVARFAAGVTTSTLDVTNLAKFNGNVTLGDASADTITATGTFQGITVSTGVGIFNAGITASGIYASTGSTFAGTLQVVGGSTLGGRVDVGGILDVVGGVTLESTLDVSGAAKFNGNIVLGDASADTITATGTFQGITVSTGVARFNAGITTSGIYASTGSTFAGTLQVDGGSTFATLARFTAGITTSGIYASTGSTFGGTLQVVGGSTFGVTDHSGAARFDSGITVKGSAANTVFDTVGNLTVGATLTVNGNFFVSGTVTTVNRTDLQIDDKFILLGRTLASDSLADGGGIILGSGLTASITWSNTEKAWRSNQGWDIAGNTYAYKIAGATALAATFLGSVITGSSLASVATITSGRWRGSILELAYGGASADLSSATLNGIVYKAANNLAVSGAGSGTNSQVLTTSSGVPSWIDITALSGVTATNVTVNSSGDSGTYFLSLLNSSSTGARAIYTDTGITFDALNNILSCTQIEAIIDGGTWV
jgi:hypothetical protein